MTIEILIGGRGILQVRNIDVDGYIETFDFSICGEAVLFEIIALLVEKEKELRFLSDDDYRDSKGRLIKKFVDKAMVALFKRITPTAVLIDNEDDSHITRHLGKRLKKKRTEQGGKKDGRRMEPRTQNGLRGELAVIKMLGGTREHLNLDVGDSSEFEFADLGDFLGHEVGVKTSRRANFPLIKCFDLVDIECNRRYLGKGNESLVIESQVIAVQDSRNLMKYYVFGVVDPWTLLSGSHPVFTKDRNAFNSNKPGGPKYGFWQLHRIVPFRTKGELCEILSRPEFQPIVLNYSNN